MDEATHFYALQSGRCQRHMDNEQEGALKQNYEERYELD